MIDLVPLTDINPNPFQTRTGIDAGYVYDLAMDIRRMRAGRPDTMGLIHVPPARRLDDGTVQLAAGHSRYAAFKLLDADFPGEEWDTMPLDISAIADEDMATIAWAENAQRRNISAIDEARAIQRAIEVLGWKQVDVALKWGLSESAISNKLRLLRLPEDAQAAIQDGRISERHGRVLLTAMGKSPTIYEIMVDKLVPPPPPADDNAAMAAEKAKDLVENIIKAHKRFAHTSYYRNDNARCEVCNRPIMTELEAWSVYYDSRHIYLCQECYKRATGWTPPPVAEAVDELNNVILRTSRWITDFPVTAELGNPRDYDGTYVNPNNGQRGGKMFPEVRQLVCEGCELSEPEKDMSGNPKTRCYDLTCYTKKVELWYREEKGILSERVKRDFGMKPPLSFSSKNEWKLPSLSRGNEIDELLVAEGTCHACKRCTFVYTGWGEERREYMIYAYDDLAFAYACDNVNAHSACIRRTKEAQHTDDEQNEIAAARRAVQERKQQAQYMATRANKIVAAALAAGEVGAWRELAARFGRSATETDVEFYMNVVGACVMRTESLMEYVYWDNEDALEKYENHLKEQLGKMELKLPPTIDDLVRRLERIEAFILGDDGQPRPELREAQLRGNLLNLEKLQHEMIDAGIAGTDRERIEGRLLGLMGMIVEFSQEKTV